MNEELIQAVFKKMSEYKPALQKYLITEEDDDDVLDFRILGDLVIKKGTPATVTITQVDRPGIGGAPGALSFEADGLHPASGPIPLQGGATRDGEAKLPNATVLIPVVGPLSALRHGTDAVITEGTPFTAYVDLGTAIAKVQ